jgi:hypothetical protein
MKKKYSQGPQQATSLNNTGINSQPITPAQTSPQPVITPETISQPQVFVSTVSPNAIVPSIPQNKSKRIIFIITGTVIVVLIALALCFFVFHKTTKHPSPRKAILTSNSSDSSTNNNPANPGLSTKATTPAVNSACYNIYKDNNLCQFFATTPLSQVAHTETSNYNFGTGQDTIVYEIDGKGNSSLTLTSNSLSVSSVDLNGEVYLEPWGSTTWSEYSASDAPAAATTITNPDSSLSLIQGANGVTYSSMGTDSCGASLMCYKYRVSDTNKPGVNQYIWINTTSYQLQEWSYSTPATTSTQTGSDGSTSQSAVPGTTTSMLISYQPVTITAPAVN